MTGLTVVPFTGGNVQDIPAGLRDLADLIEQGCKEGNILGLTDATHFAWVAVNEYGNVEAGLLGPNGDRYKASGVLVSGVIHLAKGEQP